MAIAMDRKLQARRRFVALVAWELWKERNMRGFCSAITQVPDLLAVIKREAELWVLAGAKNLSCLL